MSTDQPRCLVVQAIIESILIEVLEVLPYRVVFSNYSDIVLSITFYNLSDLKKFYDLVSLKSLCDPSGYELLEDSFTIITRGPTVKYVTEKLNNLVKNGKQ